MQRLLPLLFTFFFAISASSAQQYLFRSFGLEHGLPQSELPTPQSALVDSEGRIWVATNGGGLALLKQESYEVYRMQDGLSSNLTSSLAEDTQGNLWILSQNNSIDSYDGKRFINYPELKGALRLGGTLVVDKWDNVWVIAFGAGAGVKNKLFHKLKNESKFREYSQTDGLMQPGANLNITKTKYGELYASEKGRILKFDGQKFVRPEWSNDSIFNNVMAQVIHIDYEGNHFIRTIDPNTGRLNLYFHQKDSQGFERINIPNANFLNPNGWFVYRAKKDGSIYILDTANNIIYVFDSNRKLKTTYSAAKGLIGFMAGSGAIVEDDFGNIWVGTRGKGLVQLPNETFTNFTETDGLEGKTIFSIYQEKNKRVWLGSSSGGIVIYENGNFSTITKDLTPIGRISAFWKYQDTIYTASGIGILQIQEDTVAKTFKIKSANERFGLPKANVAATFVRNLIQLDNNTLWICTQGAGAVIYDLKTQQVVRRLGMKELSATTVIDVKKDSKGNIWIATFAGLVKWDGKESFVRYTKEDGLGDNLLLQLYIDQRDVIWAVAYSGGLSRFDGKKFRNYQTPEGLSSDIIYSILPAQNTLNEFWLGTQRGLNRVFFRTDGEVLRVEEYSKSEGFFGTESNGKAIYRDREGKIWIGHLDGVTVADFTQKRENLAPNTFLTNVSLSTEESSWTDSLYREYYDSLSSWNQLPKGLKLPAEQNSLTFSFYSSDFSNPQNVEYQWRLDNLNDDWLVPSSRSEVSYSNLPAGNYTFKVRSRTGKNADWGEATTFEFSIQPFWWQTLWAKFGGVLLLVGLVWGGVKWRTSSLEASRKQLAEIVEERTREVVKQRDEIVHKNAELENQQLKLSEAYQDIQEKNKNITASINYAKRIQDAMLPSANRIEKVLPQSFVLFKPRDIVSGDFYWMTKVEDKIVVAAVDCTGHGVPGAFMSVIGSNILYEIIESQHILTPGAILDELNENVRRHLNQDQNKNRDGMDAAICVYDTTQNILRFAGAKNPLIHIYGDKVEVIKGDRFPIGGFDLGAKQHFKEHIIKPSSDSTFYIYSDGYQDQFGGLKGKKYMSRRFQQFLKQHFHLGLEEQGKALEQELQDWMLSGNESQIDDILVIGFKLNHLSDNM